MRVRFVRLRSLDHCTHICGGGRDVLARVDRDGRTDVPIARSVDHTQTNGQSDVTVVGGHEVEVTFQRPEGPFSIPASPGGCEAIEEVRQRAVVVVVGGHRRRQTRPFQSGQDRPWASVGVPVVARQSKFRFTASESAGAWCDPPSR